MLKIKFGNLKYISMKKIRKFTSNTWKTWEMINSIVRPGSKRTNIKKVLIKINCILQMIV